MFFVFGIFLGGAIAINLLSNANPVEVNPKLATELAKKQTGKTIYILDEPTTGLHFEDVNVLMKVINKIIEFGNTVIIIEHNLDVIKLADYVIDIGPDGGNKGGKIVAEGTPEEIILNPKSVTGKFLKDELK